jgi:receptor protein-tyrosine kinase/non-specific protein-tyrosine kinase
MNTPFKLLPKESEERKPVAMSASDEEWSWENGSTAEAAEAAEAARVVKETVFVSAPTADTYPRWKCWFWKMEELLYGWDLKRYKSYPIVALEKDSPAAEQYKILREQVKKLRKENGVHCLSITSPVRGDGKTMVAVNLAAAIALDYEEEVLLVDADLRGPETHNYFDFNASPGLADYLSSRSRGDPMSYVKDTFLPGLRILPAGRRSHHASELLASEKMRNLMQQIRNRFSGHQIIVDSSPVLSTPEPLVLAKQVDGIIMVVRAEKTPRDFLFKAMQLFDPDKVKGIVLNGMQLGIGSHYYYNYYSRKREIV